MEEIWKDVVGYEGKYKVSNLGRVISLNYNNSGRCKFLTQRVYKETGYSYVKLYNKGSKKKKVHRLVAMAFVERPEHLKDIPFEDLQVDHIIPIKNGGTNEARNLRWCTQLENQRNQLSIVNHKINAARYWLGKKGKENPNSRPILQYTLSGEFVKEWDCAYTVQSELGIYQSSISRCCNGKRKSCGGYIWKYKEEVA